MKYLQFNNDGAIVGRFDSAVHGDSIPADAEKVTDEIFVRTMDESYGKWVRGESGYVQVEPAEVTRQKVLGQIIELEARQPRAVREFLLDIDGAKDRLQAIDSQIAELRKQLR